MGLLYMEVSAKENQNIAELFLETVKRVPEEIITAPAIVLTTPTVIH